MTLVESKVEEHIRNHLIKKGWKIEKELKKRSEHGVDIYASHSTWRKTYRIEVKGESASHPVQASHNAFWTILGQIVTRMDIEGNQPNKARFYAIGIPKVWEKVFKNKIKDMKFGWKLLKLKVFLVDSNGKVEEKPYTYFLKK
jgi:hypothetical protein